MGPTNSPPCVKKVPHREEKATHIRRQTQGGEVGKKAVHWASRGSEMPEIQKCSEEGQLLSHKAIPAVPSPSRAHGKMGGPRALTAKPEVDWMNVRGLMRLALKGNSKFQYRNKYVQHWKHPRQ